MIQFFYYLAIILSLLSQLPIILEAGYDAYLKFSWVPVTGILMIMHLRDFGDRKLHFFYLFFFTFLIYCFTLQSVTGNKYIAPGTDIYNIAISLMIFVDSYIYWKYYHSLRAYKFLILGVICSVIVLSYFVYRDYLRGADFTTTTYAYNAKNSLGQILFAGGVIGLTSLSLFKKNTQILIWIAIAILLIVIMQLKSRATILCVGLVVGYYVIKAKNTKLRIAAFLLVTVMIIIIMTNQHYYEIIVNNILFANRNANSISSLSSGRSDLIMAAFSIVNKNFWIGIGNKYLDCMPVAIWMQYGIFGLIIVLSFLIYLARKIDNLKRNKNINLTLFLLFWTYIANSLFEAYPPFGPGVKCFLLWMILGFAMIDNRSRSKRIMRFTGDYKINL